MSEIKVGDITGERVSSQDVRDALAAIERHFLQLMALPPSFAVHVPNIQRCLQELRMMKP